MQEGGEGGEGGGRSGGGEGVQDPACVVVVSFCFFETAMGWAVFARLLAGRECIGVCLMSVSCVYTCDWVRALAKSLSDCFCVAAVLS